LNEEPYEESERIDFVMGQIHALTAFSLALIKAHPDPGLLQTEFGKAAQAGLAKIESSPVLDAMIEGFQNVCDALQKSLANAAKGQGSPNIR
jgi:hypothetical protein